MGALDALSLANIGIFVAVLLLVEAVVTIVIDLRPGSAQRSINRRLKLLSSGLDGQTVLARLRRRGSGQASPLVRVESLLQRAGLDLGLTRLAVILAGGGIGLAMLGIAVSHLPPERAVLMAAAAVVVLPPPLLAFLVRRRLKKFAEQLPDAIDVIVRSLRAGHPVSTAIGMVCREMPDPVGSEFGIAFDEMTYGLDLREALDNLATRIAIEELRFMVVAVRIQYATGGNLAEVLAGLSKVIRDRSRMTRRVRALSAEGRLSALVLASLPFLVVGAITVLNPDYYGAVHGDPLLVPLLGGGTTGIVVGCAMMYRMVNFRI